MSSSRCNGEHSKPGVTSQSKWYVPYDGPTIQFLHRQLLQQAHQQPPGQSAPVNNYTRRIQHGQRHVHATSVPRLFPRLSWPFTYNRVEAETVLANFVNNLITMTLSVLPLKRNAVFLWEARLPPMRVFHNYPLLTSFSWQALLLISCILFLIN